MNTKQVKELYALMEEGIEEYVFLRLLQSDKEGLIEPKFQIRPVIFMIMDHTYDFHKHYNAYEREYGV